MYHWNQSSCWHNQHVSYTSRSTHHLWKHTNHQVCVILPFGILSLRQINLMSTEVLKQIWVIFCNATAIVCSAGSNPSHWPFLQLIVLLSLAVCLSGPGLQAIVQTEKEASKGKCCVTGGGADRLNMLEQYSSASWDLSPVLTLLALAAVSFSSWLYVCLPQQTSIILLKTCTSWLQDFSSEIFFSPNTWQKFKFCLYLNTFSEY